MKMCVLGGGGVRSPFLAKSIACNAHLADIDELVLMDNDAYKLSKYGQLARQIAIKINSRLSVSLTTDAEQAIRDADYIITTLRVGQDQSRLNDETIVSKYHLLAQETTGACGFAMAMRSIPELIKYCKMAQKLAHKNCQTFNFTNPSGMITQALNSLGYNVIGICDAPSEFIKQLEKVLDVDDKRFSSNCFGLNHLSWFNDFKVDGKNVTEKLLDDPTLFTKTEMRLFEPNIIDLTDHYLLNEYLYFYYYNHKAIAAFEKTKEHSRARLIYEVNQQMNSAMKDIDVSNDFSKAFKIFFDYYNIRENAYMTNESGHKRVDVYTTPTVEEYLQRPDTGGYAGVALRYVRAQATDEPCEMILSIPNNGAIVGLAEDDVIEVSCVIDKNGAHPKMQHDIPPYILNLIVTMKEYERTAIQAILLRDRKLAYRALTINPLVANYDLARSIADEFIAADMINGGSTWK